MLHWAELNCTACKKCSFCANNRTAEGASGFCVEHCCYFRSIKLKKLNTSTLEFLAFLHCSCSTDNTASEKQLALHSWHVCKKKKKKKVVFGKCKWPRPESLTRAHLPPFHLDAHLKSHWSVWKWRPRVFAFSVCVSKQLMSNVLRLNFTPVVGSGAGNGMRGTCVDKGQGKEQGPETKDSTCLFSKWISYIPPNLQHKQAINQQPGACQEEWWLGRSFSGIVAPVCMAGMPRRSNGQMLFKAGWTSLKPRFITCWHRFHHTRISIATCPGRLFVLAQLEEEKTTHEDDKTPWDNDVTADMYLNLLLSHS